MTEFAPTKTLSPIFTFPVKTAPGPMWDELPILQSCSIIQPVFNMQFSPIFTKELIDTFLLIKVPSPIITVFEIELVFEIIEIISLYFASHFFRP